MKRTDLIIEAIDKYLLKKGKNYMNLGQANKLLFDNGLITEIEKKKGYLKNLLENGEIKNAKQTETSPKQWRIFISVDKLKQKKTPAKKPSSHKQKSKRPKPLSQNNNSWKWIVGGFIAIIFVISYISDDNSKTGESDSILAYNYAKGFVSDRLKSPSTAEFPGTFEKKNHITVLGNGQYQINSWVDSQNGFGAKIRSRWSCKIIFENGQVRAENIVIY